VTSITEAVMVHRRAEPTASVAAAVAVTVSGVARSLGPDGYLHAPLHQP